MNYKVLQDRIARTIYKALHEGRMSGRGNENAVTANINGGEDSEDFNKLRVDPVTSEVFSADGELLGTYDEATGNIYMDGKNVGSLDANGGFVPAAEETTFVDTMASTGNAMADAMARKRVKAASIDDEKAAEINATGAKKVETILSTSVACAGVLGKAAEAEGLTVLDGGSAYDFWEKITNGGKSDNTSVFKTFNAFQVSSISGKGSAEETFIPFKFMGDASLVDAESLPYQTALGDKDGLGLWGFVNITKKTMIPPMFNAVTPMYGDDLTKRSAMVKIDLGGGNYKIGYIDSEGAFIHEPQFTHGYQAINGKAWTGEGDVPDKELTEGFGI